MDNKLTESEKIMYKMLCLELKVLNELNHNCLTFSLTTFPIIPSRQHFVEELIVNELEENGYQVKCVDNCLLINW
jgi:hypothetical protein